MRCDDDDVNDLHGLGFRVGFLLYCGVCGSNVVISLVCYWLGNGGEVQMECDDLLLGGWGLGCRCSAWLTGPSPTFRGSFEWSLPWTEELYSVISGVLAVF